MAASRPSAASGLAGAPGLGGLQGPPHLVGDVDRLARVQRVRDHDVEAGTLGVGLHFLQHGALQLAERPRCGARSGSRGTRSAAASSTLAVTQRLFGVAALGLGHHRAVLRQLVSRALRSFCWFSRSRRRAANSFSRAWDAACACGASCSSRADCSRRRSWPAASAAPTGAPRQRMRGEPGSRS